MVTQKDIDPPLQILLYSTVCMVYWAIYEIHSTIGYPPLVSILLRSTFLQLSWSRGLEPHVEVGRGLVIGLLACPAPEPKEFVGST